MHRLNSGINFNFSDTESPKISTDISSKSEESRMKMVPDILKKIREHGFDTDWFDIVQWAPANHFVVSLKNDDPASVRGPNLLRLEALLKTIIDPAIEVYLEAKEDKNKLRKFRGVQIVA